VIDREVLIKRHVTSHEERDTRRIEADEIQKQLKVIWLEILELDDVDDNDSFFAREAIRLRRRFSWRG